MRLEDIEEEQNSQSFKVPKENMSNANQLNPNQGQNVKEQRRGSSSMLSAAGIGYEQRRKASIQTQQDSRVFQQGNQVFVEDKDGKVTRMEILEVKEKMGLLRKAVPTLPVCIAIFLCLINCVLPGIGTFLGALSLFCCGKCRHERPSDGFKYGLVAAALQLFTAIFIVGWIYSIYYGVKMIQDSITRAAVNPQGNAGSSSGAGDQPEVTIKTQAWA